MKFLVAGSIALALIGLSPPAGAQGAPQGSYRATCTNVRMDGSTLKAICRTKAGGNQLTELHHPERCGDISNNNGVLQCQPGAARTPETPGPGYGQAPGPGYGPGPGPTPGGGPPGYGQERREGGWEGSERCERLRHRAREIRERLRYGLPPDEHREQEHRLWETRQEFLTERCGEWHD